MEMRPPVVPALLALGLTLSLSACGDENGERADVEKTPAAATPLTAAELQQAAKAEAAFVTYVQGELAALVTGTQDFASALEAGDESEAREIYPEARKHWERVEPIAAEFGDLDPAIDAREASLDPGQEWTGWHRLEKDLWPARAKNYTALTEAERNELARKLLADTRAVQKQGEDLTISLTGLVEGSQGLLEEVAGSKVTGEEEYWSRTDLWDFAANLDGARKAFDLYRPILAERDNALAVRIDDQFDAVQHLLDGTDRNGRHLTYDKLTTPQIRAMSDAVNALGESLAQVSSVLP